jgi:hypothetical protein
MNENNSKKPDEGRLIDYLLNESSAKERVEIERLCGENPDWQEAKTKLESTLGLIEDACKQPATEIEGEMELDPGRRKELESLRSGKPAEPVDQTEQEAETEERILIFKPAVWVPLAAAACAALLVWAPGLMDQETPEKQLAAANPPPAEKIGKNEKSPATGIDKRTLQSGKLGEAKSDDANADPSTSLAFKASRLKESQDKSEGASLELEEDLTIALLERRALDGANEVLNSRSARDVASLNDDIAKDVDTISLADAFAKPSTESADFSIGSDLAALPPPPSAPFKSIPEPIVSPAPVVLPSKADGDNPAIAKITSGTRGQGPGVGAGAGFIAGNRNELNPLAEDEKQLTLRRAASDDRLGINKPQDSAADFTIDTVRGRELSDNKDSAKTRKNNTLYSAVDQKRSKPASWTALVRKPSSCFLFNKNGQALGEVVVMQSAGKTIVIRRMGEIRQGKRFLLTPGQFELRFTDQSKSVVILSGELKRETSLSGDKAEAETESKGTRDGDYAFEAKDAWWLDQSEVRQALPVNELVR